VSELIRVDPLERNQWGPSILAWVRDIDTFDNDMKFMDLGRPTLKVRDLL
jgi:hypothetical protein